MRAFILAACLGLSCVAATVATAADAPAAPGERAAPALPAYHLGSGDKVRIIVYGEPTLTGCVGMGAPLCDSAIENDFPILSPDGRYLITAPGGAKRNYGSIKVYPLSSGKIEPSVHCYAHPDSKQEGCAPIALNLDSNAWLDFSPDGKTLAVRTRDNLALLVRQVAEAEAVAHQERRDVAPGPPALARQVESHDCALFG